MERRLFTSQHDVTYQKTGMFSGTAVRASNLTCQTFFNIAPNIVTAFFIYFYLFFIYSLSLWPWPVLSQPVHGMATYKCDDTRGCIIQFWPPHDEHVCSKHVEAWNKLIVKQKFCASSWLITKINIVTVIVSLSWYLNTVVSYCLLSYRPWIGQRENRIL